MNSYLKENVPLFWTEIFARKHNLEIKNLNLSSSEVNNKYRISYETNYELKSINIPGKITFGGFWPLTQNSLESSEVKILGDEFAQLNHQFTINELKLPPEYFYPEIFRCQSKFFRETLGYRSLIEVNNHINLITWDERDMSHGNRKKVNQFSLSFGNARKAKKDEYEDCIDVLIKNRENKKLNLSLSKSFVKDLLITMPEFYTLYLAEVEDKICAAALVVSIDKLVDYVLYWGDDLEFRHLSPVTTLFLEIVRNSKLSNKIFLDLGISSSEGDINVGLYRYKRNLGCQDSNKIILKL